MERTNYKMPDSTTIVVTLLEDKPYEGESEWGKFKSYSLDLNGQSVSMVASPGLHKQLLNYSKGDSVKIVKAEYAPGKQSYTVTPDSTTTSVASSYDPDDRTKDIHRQVCLKLAVQSMGVCSAMEEEFNYGEVKDRMEGLLNVLDGNKIPEKKEDLPF
jgi:hypothetical protein